MSRTYQYGNVLLQRVVKLPPNARRWAAEDDARIPLALDEGTGRVCAVSTAFAQLYTGLTDEERYLVVNHGARLVEDGATPIDLAPGVYKVAEPVISPYVLCDQERRCHQTMSDSEMHFQP